MAYVPKSARGSGFDACLDSELINALPLSVVVPVLTVLALMGNRKVDFSLVALNSLEMRLDWFVQIPL